MCVCVSVSRRQWSAFEAHLMHVQHAVLFRCIVNDCSGWRHWGRYRGHCCVSTRFVSFDTHTHTHTDRKRKCMCECVCECVARLFDKWQQFFLHIFFMLFALLGSFFCCCLSILTTSSLSVCPSVCLCMCVCVSWLILWGLLPTVCPLMKLLIFVSKVTYTMCWWRSRAASCRRAIANAPQESYNSSSSSGSNDRGGKAGGGGGVCSLLRVS